MNRRPTNTEHAVPNSPGADPAAIPSWASAGRFVAVTVPFEGSGQNIAHLLTVGEVASGARVSTKTIYRLIDAGKLQVVRIGRAIRVPAREYRRLIGRVTHCL